MSEVEEPELDKCPRRYVEWAFVVAGMIVAFTAYTLYQVLAEKPSTSLSETGSGATAPPLTGATAVSAAEEASGSLQLCHKVVVHDSTVNDSTVTLNAQQTSMAPSAFLGVEVVPVEAVIAEQLGLPGKGGVLINSVVSGSPAERAGLARGDVIVALNNRTVGDVEDVRIVMAQLQPADRIRVVYVSEEGKQLAYVQLTAAQPLQRTAGAMEPDDAPWGATLSPLSAALRGRLGLPDQVQGVAVMSVQAGGPADEAGLAAGDVIQGVDGSPVEGMNDFFSALSSDSDETALLDVYGRGRMRYVPMDSSSLRTVADQTRVDDATMNDVILTPRVNEEDDYDKPVCKRLEESGERYEE